MSQIITLSELIKQIESLPTMVLPSNEFKNTIFRGKKHRVISDIESGKEILHKVELPFNSEILIRSDQVNVTDQNFDWLIQNKIIITEEEFKAILTQGEAIIGFLCS